MIANPKPRRSLIIEHIQMIVSHLTNYEGRDYHEWALERIKVTPVPLTIPARKFDKCKPKLHQCWKNASNIVIHNPIKDIKYCEGYYAGIGGIPVEHAWNKIDGRYFDITRTLWRSDAISTNTEYAAIIELDVVELIKVMQLTKHYGPYSPYIFLHQNKIKI